MDELKRGMAARKSRMKINVIDQDNRDGIKHDCDLCAISCAILRECKAQRVCVEDAATIEIDGKPYRTVADAVDRVDKFIADFDKGLEVSPMEFEIEELPIMYDFGDYDDCDDCDEE